ncbi:hypothetical protein ACLOAV_002911 [Pseudogymnoascus australis]
MAVSACSGIKASLSHRASVSALDGNNNAPMTQSGHLQASEQQQQGRSTIMLVGCSGRLVQLAGRCAPDVMDMRDWTVVIGDKIVVCVGGIGEERRGERGEEGWRAWRAYGRPVTAAATVPLMQALIRRLMQEDAGG